MWPCSVLLVVFQYVVWVICTPFSQGNKERLWDRIPHIYGLLAHWKPTENYSQFPYSIFHFDLICWPLTLSSIWLERQLKSECQDLCPSVLSPWVVTSSRRLLRWKYLLQQENKTMECGIDHKNENNFKMKKKPKNEETPKVKTTPKMKVIPKWRWPQKWGQLQKWNNPKIWDHFLFYLELRPFIFPKSTRDLLKTQAVKTEQPLKHSWNTWRTSMKHPWNFSETLLKPPWILLEPPLKLLWNALKNSSNTIETCLKGSLHTPKTFLKHAPFNWNWAWQYYWLLWLPLKYTHF